MEPILWQKDRKFDRSAVEWAVINGHPRVVQLLSAYQQPARKVDGLLALTQLNTNQTENNDQLLSKLNNLQPGDLKRLYLLHLPASKGDETVVRTLINMGAEVNTLSGKGDTAMHRAAANGHMVIVKLLLDHGAKIDSQKSDIPGFTPLHAAIQDGNYNTVQLLIQKGADVERDSDCHGTPLMRAVGAKEEGIVGLLLESGVDPNTETTYMGCPRGNVLHNAFYCSDLSLIRLLITKDANLEAKNADGQTPQLLTVKRARWDIVSELLELGADPTVVEETTTPDCWAYEVDFGTAMQMIKDAKQRRAEFD